MFGKLLPNALPGWQAEEVQTTAVGNVGFGMSSASRRYNNPKGDNVEVQITGDSARSRSSQPSSPTSDRGAIGKIRDDRQPARRASRDGKPHGCQ